MEYRPRSTAGWAVLAAATAGLALAAMAVGVCVAGAATAGYDAAWTLGAVSAAAGMLAARGAAAEEQRATWTWLALAAAAWLVGQLAWDAFGLVGHPGSPNVADAGWWGFALLVLVGLLRMPAHGARGLQLVRLVEALPLIAAAMALTCALLWSHATRSPLTTPSKVAALVYPAVYVSAAVVTLQALVAGSLRHSRGAGTRLVLLGIVVQAVAFILWTDQLLDARYVVGRTLIDPLWVLGLLVIGVGGVVAARTRARPPAEAEPGDVGALLPAAVFALLIAAMAGDASRPLGARVALLAGLSVCGVTLVARGVLLGRRQRALLAREREARAALSQREAELERLNRRLSEDSRRDPLTGLRNRRALAEDLPAVERLAARHARPFAVALCDVDHFKAYNDRLGHLAGDDALRALAATARSELRAGDAAYRYGGEELLLVLQDADLPDALAVAERVREAVAAAALPHPAGLGGIVTVSIGVAAGRADAATLLARADTALYAAKHGGRNRVMAQDADAAPPRQPALARPERPFDEPGLRHLRSVVAVSRAGRERGEPVAVLEALAEVIRSELRFGTVVGNLRDRATGTVRAVVVLGDHEARAALLGTSSPWSDWEEMLHPRHERHGAAWLPAGSHEWSPTLPVWTPAASALPAPDAWDPEDALLLPLRDAAGEVIAVIAVDEPLSGRRPDDRELEVLMAVAEHGATVLEQVLDGVAPGAVRRHGTAPST